MIKSIQYSKKVMNLFHSIKFSGEIKNPSGIGKVGNHTCLLPEEKIYKNSDSTEIYKIKEKERVLTHKGIYENVINTLSRKYKGKIITLKNKLGKINLTPKHLVYGIKIPNKDKFKRNSGKKSLSPAWYHAEELSKGDIVLYPKLAEKKDIKFLKINIPKPKYDFRSKKIHQKIPLDKDLLRLIGYFLSEGNIQDKPCKTYISFSLHIKEKDIVDDIKKISKKLFNLNIKTKERLKEKCIIVYLYNAQLARWFKSLFGNGAEHKKLPNFIMNLPIEKQKSLLYGLWKGDGYVNLKRVGPRAGYSTISYQLAQQIKILLLKQNIVPSIYIEPKKTVRGVNHKKAYRLHVGQRDSLKKLCSILKIKYNPNSYESIKSWFDKNYLYIPITNKEIYNYQGKVYNLEVENSHSFISEAFCLHNCGDVMYIYIKVEKNKKGKEYIKDIKYKTLGCVAAIAFSEELCRLAKGKTLKDAKKITNQILVKRLEKVPKIKYHCSLLAEQALKNAIKDYENKK